MSQSFLQSFSSIGLAELDFKFEIVFQNGGRGGHIGFLIDPKNNNTLSGP